MIKNNIKPVFACFDLETTGLDSNSDSIIEIGVVKFDFDESGKINILEKYSQLINPEKPISSEITFITNISNDDVSSAPKIFEVEENLKSLFSNADYILGHNVNFDLSFINKIINLKQPSIDSQFFAELFFPGLPSYSLDVLPYKLNIDRGNGHRAYDDALVSVKIFIASLNQFASFSENTKIKIENTLRLSNFFESNILSLAKIIKPKKILYPEINKKQTIKKLPENIKSLIDKYLLDGGKHIITHTASHGISESIANYIYTGETNKNTVIAISNPKKLENEQKHIFDYLDRLICDYKLNEIIQKKSFSQPEGLMLSKLLASQELSSDYKYWPRMSIEERYYLPKVLVYPSLCDYHECRYKQIKNEIELSKVITTSHYDISNEIISSKLSAKSVVLIDFDETINVYYEKSENKIYQDTIPAILDILLDISNQEQTKVNTNKTNTLPLFSSKEKGLDLEFKKLIEDVYSKNDLFWGLCGIIFKPENEQYNYLYVDSSVLDSMEYKKIIEPAKKLFKSINTLTEKLAITNNLSFQSYAIYFNKIKELINIITSKENNIYIEKNNEQISIKWMPTLNQVSKELNKLFTNNVIYISSTGSAQTTNHYKKLIGIDNLDDEYIEIQEKPDYSLLVVSNVSSVIENSIKILNKSDFRRAIIVAKNLSQVKIFTEHLINNIDKKYKIIMADSTGGGSHKAINKFNVDEYSILVTSARSQLFSANWPKVDLAIITTIPFPPPNPALSFLEGSLTQAIREYKNIYKKIIENANSDLEIYMLEERLLAQNYGKNFINLAEELSKTKAQYINI